MYGLNILVDDELNDSHTMNNAKHDKLEGDEDNGQNDDNYSPREAYTEKENRALALFENVLRL